MTITELCKRRGRLYALFLDGEPAGTIDSRTMDESPWKVGSVLTPDDLRALRETSERNRAREKALYLLSMRDHSRVELERKLRADASRETAAQTTQRMEELGLLDDTHYAQRLARDLCGRRMFSRRHAYQELCARGIARDLAEQALDEAEPDDEAQALTLLRRKYSRKLDDPDDRRRTIAALARTGFGYRDIRAAITAWDEEREQETEEQETDDENS